MAGNHYRLSDEELAFVAEDLGPGFLRFFDRKAISRHFGPELLNMFEFEELKHAPLVQKAIAEIEQEALTRAQKAEQAEQEALTRAQKAEQAEQEAHRHSLQKTLLHQLQHRFGNLPEIVIYTIETTTDTDQLDRWLEQILDAQTLADMAFPSD